MWIFTGDGFYSVVEKPGDRTLWLTVRSRARDDLERLRRQLPAGMVGGIIAGGGTDYPFRMPVAREALARYLSEAVWGVDYPNFKEHVARLRGKARAHVLLDVWRALPALGPRLARRARR